MSYQDQAKVVGRQPAVALELELDYCPLTFGQAPCGASGSLSGACYNTRATCQAPTTYQRSTKVYRFWPTLSNLPHQSTPRFAGSLIDEADWVVGSSGTQTSANQPDWLENGQAGENSIIRETGPYGTTEAIWQGVSNDDDPGDSPDIGWDGGWNKGFPEPFDPTQSYRVSVWVNRKDTLIGSTYLGCGRDGLTVRTDDTALDNPYFWFGDLPQNDKWYLLVGILHGSEYEGGQTGVSGVYDPDTGLRVSNGVDYKIAPGAATQTHRAYYYYSTELGARQWFAHPRIDVIDGTEVSRATLLATDQLGAQGFPAIVGQPAFTSASIDPDKGMGARGVVRVTLQDFTHHDRGVDPYAGDRLYDPMEQGTFFGRFKARNPYYIGREMRLRVGYLTEPFDWSHFQTRRYVIESIDGPDGMGRVTITGKDILKRVEDARTQAPAPSDGKLLNAIDDSSTAQILLNAGDGEGYRSNPFTGGFVNSSNPGYVRVGREIIRYTNVSVDFLQGITRGAWNTQPESHEAGSSVQQCLSFDSINVVDILYFLLTEYGGIDPVFIDYNAGFSSPTTDNGEWADEKENWLQANNLTHIVTNPTGLTDLLKTICQQNLIYIWWDEIQQTVRMRAIAPVQGIEFPVILTDEMHILADSVSVSDQDKNRLTQVWVYFDQINPTERNSPENYRSLQVTVDADGESQDQFDSKRAKIIYADWINNLGLVLTLSSRMLNRFNQTPKRIRFAVDAKTDVRIGQNYNLQTRYIQGPDGSNRRTSIQLLKVSQSRAGHRTECEAVTTDSFQRIMPPRFGVISPNTVPDYQQATSAQLARYAFANTGDNQFPSDDGEPYWIS